MRAPQPPIFSQATPPLRATTGGVRTGGYPKAAPVPGPLGFQRLSDWDLLWSPARTALKAAPVVKPGQLISAMPGMYCLTKKVGPAAGRCQRNTYTALEAGSLLACTHALRPNLPWGGRR